jgi:signal transduction histidine kinase
MSLPASSAADADVSREIDDVDWIISARHQTGSLEAFVAQYRRRNLTLGMGTVIVLGASFVFLFLATRRAQELADRQIEFVAGVSHELRTPIAGISSLSQNLADGVVRDPPHVARYGESINAESRRLQEMVEKVLHFAAVRSGHHRYTVKAIDLASMVERELETFTRYRDGNASLVLTVEGDVPAVLGDEQALRTVVRNLVSNAIKFGKDDAPVTVSARRAGGSGHDEVELRVEDRGEGIGSADLPHIFDPFYRGKGASAAQVGGSGLGLSLVREIVKAHHGRIEVATSAGEGSIFRVYLPIAAQQEP